MNKRANKKVPPARLEALAKKLGLKKPPKPRSAIRAIEDDVHVLVTWSMKTDIRLGHIETALVGLNNFSATFGERSEKLLSFAESLLPRLDRRIKDLVLVSSAMAELCDQHNDLALDIEKMEARVIETHVILQGLLRILVMSQTISQVDYQGVNERLERVEFPRRVKQRPRVKFEKPAGGE